EADVREFESALARARGATGGALVHALSKAVDLYRGPLVADAAWDWLEPVRLNYRGRYVSAALQLADVLAATDPDRSDGLADAELLLALRIERHEGPVGCSAKLSRIESRRLLYRMMALDALLFIQECSFRYIRV